MNSRELWDRYRAWLFDDPELGVRVDVSRMDLPQEFIRAMAQPMGRAFEQMDALEKGSPHLLILERVD